MSYVRLNDPGFKEARRLLGLAETKPMARGAFAAVFPTKKGVMKITTDAAAYALLNDNVAKVRSRHLPKVITNHGALASDREGWQIYAYETERLYPIRSGANRKLRDLIVNTFPPYADERSSFQVPKEFPRSMKILYTRLHHFLTYWMSNTGYDFDLHSGNFMQRLDGTLVFSDPVYDSKQSMSRMGSTGEMSW
jgi:hypothetical protein